MSGEKHNPRSLGTTGKRNRRSLSSQFTASITLLVILLMTLTSAGSAGASPAHQQNQPPAPHGQTESPFFEQSIHRVNTPPRNSSDDTDIRWQRWRQPSQSAKSAARLP